MEAREILFRDFILKEFSISIYASKIIILGYKNKNNETAVTHLREKPCTNMKLLLPLQLKQVFSIQPA